MKKRRRKNKHRAELMRILYNSIVSNSTQGIGKTNRLLPVYCAEMGFQSTMRDHIGATNVNDMTQVCL